MARVLAMALASFLPLLLLLLLLPQPASAQYRPAFCIAQFALANRACAVLPPSLPPPASPAPSNSTWPLEGRHGDHDDQGEGEHSNGGGGGRRHHHRHGRGQKPRPRAPARDPSAECCRWIREMETECVCKALLRLPRSLVKPKHSYSVSVGTTCNLTFHCGDD